MLETLLACGLLTSETNCTPSASTEKIKALFLKLLTIPSSLSVERVATAKLPRCLEEFSQVKGLCCHLGLVLISYMEDERSIICCLA